MKNKIIIFSVVFLTGLVFFFAEKTNAVDLVEQAKQKASDAATDAASKAVSNVTDSGVGLMEEIAGQGSGVNLGTGNTAAASNTNATTIDGASNLGFKGIVPCGTDATGPCTLCHLIIGIYRIFKYGLYLVVTAGLVGVFIGGAMYLIASGSEEMINSAKRVISASLIGFSLVLGGWLIVNIILNVLPTDSGLGISKTNWYTFNCDTTSVTGEALKTTEETSKDQVTQRENDPCTPNKAPWCLQGLKCSGEKCIPDETAATTCMKSTTQWVKTDNCASGGTTPEGIRVSATVELASWYCSCRGSKSSEGYKCCDGVVAISAKKQGGCCIGPKDSYKYTKCFDGESLTEDDCYFMTNSGNEKGEYFANKKCVDVTVSGEARKACQ